MTENRSKDRSKDRPSAKKASAGQRGGSGKSAPSRAGAARSGGRSAAPPGWNDPLRPQLPLASGRWIAGAILASLAAAVLCIYAAICLLFWQGQWQLVFHPSHSSAALSAPGLKRQEVRFDATETGEPRMDGWWIPAAEDGRYAEYTVLFLRDGSGSLPDSLAQLEALHSLGINVFAFDYRGFGTSVSLHPSEKSLRQDAEAAWSYLTGTRHLAPGNIVFYGEGLGAAVAAESAARHPESPALILENPQRPVLETLRQQPRMRLLPLRLLFHDRFDPTATLSRLRTPKLFVSTAGSPAPPETPLYYHGAADPKASVALPAAGRGAAYPPPGYLEFLRRFLDEYLPGGAPPKTG